MGRGDYYRHGKKETTEGRLTMDVRWLQRRGYLTDNWFSLSWSRRGETRASVEMVGGREKVVFNYRTRPRGAEHWEAREEPVRLSWTPCYFGGERPWFHCPRCNKRVAVLYLDALFRCRHCADLVYESQREDGSSRLLRKAQKIRERLGGSGNMLEDAPPKPKGMHWTTFTRLIDEAEEAGDRSLLLAAKKLGILTGGLARIGRLA